MTVSIHIREIDINSTAEIEQVARRMRQTLVEVLGEERGGSMYTMAWLVKRVRTHLDPNLITGEVFVAVDGDGAIAGHIIVRIDEDSDGKAIGLFSTSLFKPWIRPLADAKAVCETG